MLKVLLRGAPRVRRPVLCLHSRTVWIWSKKVPPVSQSMDEVSLPPAESSNIPSDHFIPLTRRSVFRAVYQEKKLLGPDERADFEELAVALDDAISRRYQEHLMELKNLFDPINPDKDTKDTRRLTRRDRLDTEFFLLQRLSDLVRRANFRELSRKEVELALKEHSTRQGVKVAVDLAQYDVLKFWVLGLEPPSEAPSLLHRLLSMVRSPSKELEKDVARHKRVLMAVRMKREDKLALKLFKDIPVNCLEQLLPEGRLSMTDFDQLIVRSTLALGVSGLALKLVASWLDYSVQWSLVITAVAAAVAVRAWGTHKVRRQAYLSRLNQLLYWHNVANNRGLLTLIADRAQEEAFKEALLVFAFLHSAREPMTGNVGSSDTHLPIVLDGGLSRAVLQARVENWLHDQCQVEGIRFEAAEAVRLLASLGIVVDEGELLRVSAPSIHDLLARLPESPRATALTRPSPADDEAFEGPRGEDVMGRSGWQ